MRLNKQKVDLIRARKGIASTKVITDAKISSCSYYKGFKSEIDPVTVGRIAKALEVDVTEIID